MPQTTRAAVEGKMIQSGAQPAGTRASVLGGYARALRVAAVERTPIDPLSTGDPELTLGEAYVIQRENIDARLAAGSALVGWKVGLTSRPMQEMLGVREPDFGALLDDMVLEDGDELALSTLIQPRIEAEIGLVLRSDLVGPGVTTVRAARAIEAAVPVLEVIDSRIADWRIGLSDTVADNASSARVVLGSRLSPIKGLDLRLLGMALSVDGEVVATGAGAAVLGNPVRCVAWLANKLAEFGESLSEGDLVLPGALHAAVDLVAGTSIRAEFAEIGSVGVRVVDVNEDRGDR